MTSDDTALKTPSKTKSTASTETSVETKTTDNAAPEQTKQGNPQTPTSNPESNSCLQLKGSMFTLTVLELHRYRYSEFTKAIEDVVKQAPNFFNQTPVIINLDKLEDPEESVDFIDLIQICQEYGLHPIAIKGGNEDQQINALVAGLPKLPSSGQKTNETRTPGYPSVDELIDDDSEHYTTKIIHHPVRSGQQIYAQGGDLIILNSVSAGAEILADGNIHVYGSLRGRALAGVKGNQSARIFCQKLEAELISIAGHYKISEDLRGPHWQQGIQASLNGKQLTIKAL